MDYKDIIKRNEQLIDTMYDMNDEITDLVDENDLLNRENDCLLEDNMILEENNKEMKQGIAELHKQTARGRNRARAYNRQAHLNSNNQPMPQYQPHQNQYQPTDKNEVPRRSISFFLSDKTKNSCLFGFLIFFILLLGLGIEPGVALNYESILDCYLELVFNLYNVCILGSIGFILRRLWKKLNK
jgi:hypothetical protein